MKIVVVGPCFPDSFARNIVVTLEAMGHTVKSLSSTRVRHHQNRLVNAFWRYGPLAIPQLDDLSWRPLLTEARDSRPDLILLTYGIPPKVISGIRDLCSAKICCWYTDPVANTYRAYLLAGEYDAVFLKEPYLVPVLRNNLGLNAHYLPEACNPHWHAPIDLNVNDRQRYACDIAAAGTLHYYRARMLEPLVDYDLKIWGGNCPPWLESSVRGKYQRQFVAESEKAKAYRAAKIFVNTMHYNEVEGVNCTLFEVAGCGAFQIADWKPSLPALFEPESEVVTFISRKELKEKIAYYLAHEEERLAISGRACRRAHRDHTYAHRLRQIFAILGLEADGGAVLPTAARGDNR